MKTTIELPDKLMREIKRYAADKGVSFKVVVETALRNMLSSKRAAIGFTLRKATFKGKGLLEEVQEGDWSRIRSKIYEGRGE
jgi:hypothetical protein